MNRIPLIVLAAVLTLTGAARADDFAHHVANIDILQLKSVQHELGITQPQRDQMTKFGAVYTQRGKAHFAQLQKAKSRTRQPDATMIGYLLTLKGEILSTLSSKQLKRLDELSLQHFGLPAVLDQVVADRLGIGIAQLKKMRTVFAAGAKQANALEQGAIKTALLEFKGKKAKSRDEAVKMQKQAQANIQTAMKGITPQEIQIRNRAKAAMLAAMTPAQKSAWKAMQGAPFHSKS